MSELIDWTSVPKKCGQCKRVVSRREWIQRIGQGGWSKVADKKNYFEFKCECGNKMSVFIAEGL